jgi:tRNA 2-thiouridine synthesizing protein B
MGHMSILHLVNKSPYERNSLDTCVGYCREGDAVLLIEDGVYAAISTVKAASRLSGLDVCVLGPDLQARGISEDKLVEGVKVVDYADFVDLVEAKDKVQSWL